jgi:hypothetical protein
MKNIFFVALVVLVVMSMGSAHNEGSYALQSEPLTAKQMASAYGGLDWGCACASGFNQTCCTCCIDLWILEFCGTICFPFEI